MKSSTWCVVWMLCWLALAFVNLFDGKDIETLVCLAISAIYGVGSRILVEVEK